MQTFKNQLSGSPKGKHRTDGSEFEMTRDKVRSSNERYSNLKAACDALMDRLTSARDKQRDYNDCKYKAQTALVDAQSKAEKLRAEPVATEPHQVQEQLDKVKNFSGEVFAQGKNLDDLKKAAKSLTEAMRELGADEDTIMDINDKVKQLERQHGAVTDMLNAKSNSLQTALVQSQGVQEGIDGLLDWLRGAEGTLNTMRPVSLSEEILNDQV